MLKAGQFYCFGCGKKHNLDKALWADRENKITFSLKKTATGYQPDYVHTYQDNLDSIHITDVTCLNGFPKEIKAEYAFPGNKILQVTLRNTQRVCPCCFNKGHGRWMKLMPDAGFYPSFHVGLVGVMETGKTVYKNAVSRAENYFTADDTEIRSLYQAGEFTSRSRQGFVDAPEPTTLEQIETAVFTVRRHSRDFFKIYLTDTAGELSDLEQHETEKANKACSFISDFADALLIVMDPRYIDSPDLEEYQAGRKPVDGSISLILNDCSHRNIPCGLIMTGSDRLKDIAAQKAGIHDRNGFISLAADCELFSDQKISRQNLNRHCALAEDALKSLGIETRISMKNGTFLVSSARDEVIDGKPSISYRKQMNVKFPIVWILNHFGIINID